MNETASLPQKETYFKKILLFSIPLMLTGILQSLYNAADLIVVGRFDGNLALAAVGSTGSLTNLILGMFTGLSVGAGVCVAHGIGANNKKDVREVLHTSVLLAVVLGAVVGIIGFFIAPELLVLMNTPDDVLEMASLYIRIIFLGSPVSMLYNYCASMLRAGGDSKHPLIYLTVSGLVNIVLNVVLVAVFHLGVAGVAIATVFSQLVSAVLIIWHLRHIAGAMHFSFKLLRIHKDKLKKILIIGIPSGIQGSLFSLSNVMIQSSINGFGSTVVAANSAVMNIEGFFYQAYHAFYDCALTFVGQAIGAGKLKKIKRIVLNCIYIMLIIAVFVTALGLVFKDTLMGFYIGDDVEVLEIATVRYVMLISTYCLCGLMEIGSGTLRSMGRSVTSTVISLTFVCALRIIWLKTVFVLLHTPECIYVTYPLSWALTALVSFIFVVFAVRREIKRQKT